MTETKTFAGINPRAGFNHFTEEEWKIIKKLSKSFYITNGGGSQRIGQSVYRYCLLKFPDDKAQIFGPLNEIIVLFSPFDRFEPRTLDAIEKIQNENPGYRLDKISCFVFCRDTQFLDKLDGMVRSNKESRVVIPFSYYEINDETSGKFFDDRIKKYYFSRDLFDFESPLRTDLYFFGREGLSHVFVDKHFSSENGGIFGLRKSGKTSILFSIARIAETKGAAAVIVDCQRLHLSRWWSALYYIVRSFNEVLQAKLSIDEAAYTEYDAPDNFEKDIARLVKKINNKVLLILDEVEQITFGLSPSEAWRGGEDYLKFWHVIRSLFQKPENPLTFIVSGTNPRCIESPTVNGVDNPIFSQFKPIYIPGFEIEETKKMVATLGRYMGLAFDEDVFTYLTRDFGGHPFLIRQICSYINSSLKKSGFTGAVDRAFYLQCRDEFNSESGFRYCDMVIGVLSEHYPDEYTMLSYLAGGQDSDFEELAESDLSYVQHLLGYGVVSRGSSGYDFRIDVLKQYLARKNKYKNLHLTNDQKISEIGERRHKTEMRLRKVVMRQLLAVFGEEVAKNMVMAKHDHAKKRKYASLAYRELFDPNKHEIYFDDLRELMRKNWDQSFRNIFAEDVEKFNSRMIILNSIGRSDAHAKEVADHDMESFRGAMSWLEEKLSNFLD
ncbi:hypothetical protein ABIC33_004420 [Variovorax sp. 1140]|uniref:AAA-like domain-containing protein n=1 Tax=Variovorax atrisoli TaxID=3394203 RepID=UPI003395326C